MKFETKDLPKHILATLGVMSLLQGELDLGTELQNVLFYYQKARDLVFYPVQLIGVQIDTSLFDFIIIASITYAAANRSKLFKLRFIVINFYGGIVYFLIVSLVMGLMDGLTDLIPSPEGLLRSEMSDGIKLVLSLIALLSLLLVLLCLLVFLCSILAVSFSMIYSIMLILLPELPSLFRNRPNTFKALARFSSTSIIGRTSELLYLPGYFLVHFIRSVTRKRKTPYQTFVRFSGSLNSSFDYSFSDILNYYFWILRFVLRALLVVLIFKVIFDTLN